MKLLSIHSDFIEFEARKKAIKSAEEIDEKKGRMEECLTVFIAVEKNDEADQDNSVDLASKEIRKNLDQIKTSKIMLYPYAHLSPNLSKPDVAVSVMKKLQAKLKKDDPKLVVSRAPFGWYKSFNISCKGHPLSELSSQIGPILSRNVEEEKASASVNAGKTGKSSNLEEAEEPVSQALKDEAKLKSHWYIMDTNSKLVPVKEFNFSNHKKLKQFSFYETEKDRTSVVEPAHIALMKKLELVDYEPASDSGNFRYYPKGRLVKKLLEEYVTDKVIAYGGLEVETPIMYDMKHPTLERYLNKFPARQYQITSDKRNFFLRFAACFGQFLIAHDAVISYKQLPLRLYEMTRYSFRREQSGELSGIRRLRAFTMPDVHALCADMDQALEEYKVRLDLILDVLKGLDLTMEDFEIGLRITKDFYEKNKGLVEHIIKKIGKPILVEMWDERKFYFVLKYEFNFIDSVNKAAALSIDQVDVENGERYDMKFTDKNNKQKHPIVLHCSPSGAIERVIYALLEKAAEKIKRGEAPSLPLWLSPAQIRVIPVANDKHLDFSIKLAEELTQKGIRVDVDDNENTLGKKIRNAGTEWVPYVLVIGDNEMSGKELKVRVRGEQDQKTFSKDLLVKEIKDKTAGFPFKPLALPMLLSKRPIFSSFK